MDPMERFKVGAKGSVTKTISQEAVASFAELTGDTQPLHLDPSYGGQTRFGKQVAHGVISAGLISAVLGVEMAGPNVTVIFLGMNIRFVAPGLPRRHRHRRMHRHACPRRQTHRHPRREMREPRRR